MITAPVLTIAQLFAMYVSTRSLLSASCRHAARHKTDALRGRGRNLDSLAIAQRKPSTALLASITGNLHFCVYHDRQEINLFQRNFAASLTG